MFCSPFRRRKKKKEKLDLDSYHLTREEAWQLYLTKLEEEANYLTVPEEVEEDICTCHTCIVSVIKHSMALSAYRLPMKCCMQATCYSPSHLILLQVIILPMLLLQVMMK